MSNESHPGTTEPGYVNRNAQRVIRATGIPGTDQSKTSYVLECEQCQHRYAANGADIFERRCPKCQTGKPGLPIDAAKLA